VLQQIFQHGETLLPEGDQAGSTPQELIDGIEATVAKEDFWR
jgi:hypothetical protein